MMRFFSDCPEVFVFTSQCLDDFSLLPGQVDLTKKQKDLLNAQLGFSLPPVINIRQVHGNRVIIVGPENVGGKKLQEADGIITSEMNVAIVIRTADCLPVFLYDAVQSKIGIVHAGWKGTQMEVVKHAVELMESTPGNLKAAFGPAIQSCCFEVGGDVFESFRDAVSEREGKYFLNLQEVNKKQLIASGVVEENILNCAECTCCNEKYFSYRRQGESSGRMLSLMKLRLPECPSEGRQ